VQPNSEYVGQIQGQEQSSNYKIQLLQRLVHYTVMQDLRFSRR
jgi:hypothetical protein